MLDTGNENVSSKPICIKRPPLSQVMRLMFCSFFLVELINFMHIIVQVNQLFRTFDANADGVISRDDFMICLRRNPLLIAIFAAQAS